MTYLFFLPKSITEGIIGSLIAGFITIGLVEFYNVYKLKFKKNNFKKIFGYYSSDKLHLIVPAFKVRPDVIEHLKTTTLPYNGYPLNNYSGKFIKSSRLLAYADTLAAKYILDLTAEHLGPKSIFITDEYLQNKLDISFIAFGGGSFYSNYVLEKNAFYKYDGIVIKSVKNNSKEFRSNSENDYGFIIKYIDENFPTRVWIVIAGLGESGTRGASWFLSKNWKNISKKIGSSSFGIIVQVKQGVDESAIEVDFIN